MTMTTDAQTATTPQPEPPAIPTARVRTATRMRSLDVRHYTYWVLEIECPHCRRVHVHGGRATENLEEAVAGHRRGNCPPEFRDNPGYYAAVDRKTRVLTGAAPQTRTSPTEDGLYGHRADSSAQPPVAATANARPKSEKSRAVGFFGSGDSETNR